MLTLMAVRAADSWLALQVLREDRLRVQLPNERSAAGWKSSGHPGVQTRAGDPWPWLWRLLLETGEQRREACNAASAVSPAHLWQLSGTSSNMCLEPDVDTVQFQPFCSRTGTHDGRWTGEHIRLLRCRLRVHSRARVGFKTACDDDPFQVERHQSPMSGKHAL